MLPTCFAQRFLEKSGGGACGVFGAAYYSLSGPNDGLTDGMFDAIWANPGLIPHFTGYGANPIGTPTSHNPIYTMGDVMNQGLIRMVQTWGEDTYTNELFHYFGDPAMRIWTNNPTQITADIQDSIHCKDTVFTINSSNCSDCIASLVVDGLLVSTTLLSGGSGILHFPAFNGINAVLTLSKQNYRPFIRVVPSQNNCLRAGFSISTASECVAEIFTFTDNSSGSIVSYEWNFGLDAIPQTANTMGPHNVTYSASGYKTITLMVKSNNDSALFSKQIFIEPFCAFNMIYNGYLNINQCNGALYDNGGNAKYSHNSNDTATISVLGSTSLVLNIASFDVEAGNNGTCNNDKLEIYDGNSVLSPLIGTYCNSYGNTPPNTITTNSGNVTFKFTSNSSGNGNGFIIEWNCNQNNQPPTSNFYATLENCSGYASFTDISSNNPSKWHWDFGDGDTSNIANPTHYYSYGGYYSPSLKVTNLQGNNTTVKQNYINIQKPGTPEADNGNLCKGDSVLLFANAMSGVINWYDSIVEGNFLKTGNSYQTHPLDTTTNFYIETVANDYAYLSPVDSNMTSGGFYGGSTNHFLRFDCFRNIILKSVKVFANNTALRRIQLLNSSGTVLKDTNINIAAGVQRLTLNYHIPQGANYQLLCFGNNSLYRNSAGANYPYRITDYVSINGSSFSPDAYYYFYNWEIDYPQCTSPRVVITANVFDTVPASKFTFIQNDNIITFNNQSTNAIYYKWDFGDGQSSTQTNPIHSYATQGTYYVTLKAKNPCDSSIFLDTINIVIVGLKNTNNPDRINIFPNPTSGIINISYYSDNSKSINLKFFDLTGREMKKQFIEALPGLNNFTVNIENFTSGIYFLKLTDEKESVIKKIVKN